LKDSITLLCNALTGLGSRNLVVVTGAGISLASGIPTFRGSDPDAVWANDIMEKGTNQYFERDPVGSWTWYLTRFDGVLDKHPNPAHLALAAIERWHVARDGRYVLITQNVDPLHEKAGSERLIKVHGTADQVRCTKPGCENAAPSGALPRAAVDSAAFLAAPRSATLPRCPSCGFVLRQHVLWFDEYYDGHDSYQWQRVIAAAAGADLMLFVGTSFSVGVTDMFLRSAIERRLPAFSIDPGATSAPHPQIELLNEPAEELLPRACTRLGAQ
jgi:NAD-dependent SIR2 family protein deacetylase